MRVYISPVLSLAETWCSFTVSGSHIPHVVFCKYVLGFFVLLTVVSPL